MENQPQEAQIIDKLPYISLLCQRLNDVSVAISRDKTGEDEVSNLIFSLPQDWLTGIQQQIVEIYQEAAHLEKQEWIKFNTNQQTVNTRNFHITQLRRNAVRRVTQIIVSMLDKKGLLFMSKPKIEQGTDEIENYTEEDDI